MDDQNNDDMDSLFEGMILFTPQAVDNHDANSRSDVFPSLNSDSTMDLSSTSLPSSQPLDENLFSDLTVITPSHVEPIANETWIPTNSSPAMTMSAMKSEPQGAPVGTVLRQSSRKKKRAGLRIGYGRDSHHAEDSEPLQISSELSTSAENSLPVATGPTNYAKTDYDAGGEEKLKAFHIYSDSRGKEQVASNPTQHESECIDVSSNDMVESHSNQVNNGGPSNLAEENCAPMIPEATVLPTSEKHEKEELEVQLDDSLEGKYVQVKAQILEKLRQAREKATSISAERKDSKRRRRKAIDNVELASVSYKEIEKKLEEACEAEDFEMAEHLSESLAAAEKEKEIMLNALREVEANCDIIDSKMEEALEHQIAVEEECASLLQRFSEDAVRDADLVMQNVKVESSNEMEEWLISVEEVETKKLELEIESQVVNEARSRLNDSIEHLVEQDVKEKAVFCERKILLTQQLEELKRLVQEKEAEITENDSNIEAADKKIADVVSCFEDVQTGIESKLEKLQIIHSQTESECQALSKRKEEIDYLLSQGKERGKELRKLAMDCENEAKTYLKNLTLRKALIVSALKVREEKLRLAKTEETIVADAQMLKQEISVARVDLQELSSNKSSIQQEGASMKQRMLFIDKRIPELEAEKKVAASARNFKEAARVASEAKSLMAEKETLQSKIEESELELGKIEKKIDETIRKLHEFEELILSTEREAAIARFQRLRLISASNSCERSSALELGDLEEANVLLAEGEAADCEAKQLQSGHNIRVEEFGSLSEQFIPMELVSGLDGMQLEELAARDGYQSSL